MNQELDGTMGWNVIWARGESCGELAALLAERHAVKAESDLRTSCLDNKATLVVTGRLPSFDHCSVAVPHELPDDLGEITEVVAAVSGGPHSRLAVLVAKRLANRLGVAAGAVACYRGLDGADAAASLVTRIGVDSPGIPTRTLELRHPGALGNALEPGALLVLGAPGGSWFQREIFGPGARLRAGASGGAVVVRQSSARVYQVMHTARAVGSHMRVRDAIELTTDEWVAVADHGKLAGVVARSTLLEAPPHVDLARIISPPLSVPPEMSLAEAAGILAANGGGALPVADPDGHIHGSVAMADLIGDGADTTRYAPAG